MNPYGVFMASTSSDHHANQLNLDLLFRTSEKKLNWKLIELQCNELHAVIRSHKHMID